MVLERMRRRFRKAKSARSSVGGVASTSTAIGTTQMHPVPSIIVTAVDDLPTATAPLNVEDRFGKSPAEAKKGSKKFRVLVIGRSNAGKTTLLQRFCNTTDQPQVFDTKGIQINAPMAEASLENELVFQSKPNFVFHDSCGFEAGVEEFTKMKLFVNQRTTRVPERRLHVIWLCIPMNEYDRLITSVEEKFFKECYKGEVPVIVLLTKCEALYLAAIGKLRDEGIPMKEAKKMAPNREMEMLDNLLTTIKKELGGFQFPPKDYVVLKKMNEYGADCTSLLKCTVGVLDDEASQLIL